MLKAIDGKEKRTFAYPCGDQKIGNVYFYKQLENDFAGARGVSAGMQAAADVNLNDIKCYMIGLVKKAQQSNTLLVFLFHGVGGGHNINVSLDAHSKLLHYLKANEKSIWIAPMVNVAENINAFQTAK